MGDPLKGWAMKHVKDDGEINWTLACPYQLEWGERDSNGVAVSSGMTFFGGSKQPLNVTIDTNFELIDPWDVFKARLYKEGSPPTNYFLNQFFPVGQGPNKSKISKKGAELEAQALVAKEKFEAAKKTVEDATVSGEQQLGDERKKKQGEKLKAIHATIQQNAKRRRTVPVAALEESHAAGGTPVIQLEQIFDRAPPEATGGAASTHANDGDHLAKGKGKGNADGGGDGATGEGEGAAPPAAAGG